MPHRRATAQSAYRHAALVDDVHFATRPPKHVIMGALVNMIGRHLTRWKPGLARATSVQ